MLLRKTTFAILISVPLWANAQEITLNQDSINQIRTVVTKELIAPALEDKNTTPDWNKIERNAKKKYGLIGEEKIYGARMIYHYEKKDWENFGKYYALYYKTAYSRSEYHINNLSWPIFEHITDRSILNVAINTMKYSIEHFDQTNYQAYDTYANLLYKTGNKQKAIEWQEKAVKALPDHKEIANNLEKMKKNEPTWN
ncbi:tetratricopeptide repeat protein [Chitinophaga filiformis]|uniref:Uncharacterized protein n=1 Tax=Chitinophaga filiformis TaxID=104663 RepID=A0A1G7HKU8_CHIFI|nr:hypothetical protein [Chitinophaga filiformis]SDF00981.1 hypothetical protein SAMN04488121_101509 [Chitinophaga filiformis]